MSSIDQLLIRYLCVLFFCDLVVMSTSIAGVITKIVATKRFVAKLFVDQSTALTPLWVVVGVATWAVWIADIVKPAIVVNSESILIHNEIIHDSPWP